MHESSSYSGTGGLSHEGCPSNWPLQPTRRLTAEGFILGTAGYMAPEQIEGRPIDHRADIFALGCIIYEAVTSQRAFQGSTTFATLQKIVNEHPRPVSSLKSDTPRDLQRVIERCLAKDPDERFQSAKDVAIELRQVQAQLGSDSAPATIRAAPRRIVPFALAAALAGTVIALLFLVPRASRRESLAPANAAPLPKFERITNSGLVESAAISPDGNYVVYSLRDGLKYMLRLQHLTSRSDVQIGPPREANNDYRYMSFSRDGGYVYFTSPSKRGLFVLERIPVLGGESSEVLDDVDGGVEFSPDGQRMAFVRGAEKESYLMVAHADGTAEEKLITITRPAWIRQIRPAWSPDGKTIAFCIEGAPDTLALLDLSTKAVRKGSSGLAFSELDWLPNNNGLIAVALKPGDAARQFWTIDPTNFAARSLTSGIDDYAGLSMSDDGKRIVSTVRRRHGNLWLTSLSGADPDRQILSGSVVRGSGGVTFLADGRIVYTSDEARLFDLRVCNPDGSNSKKVIGSAPKQITHFPSDNMWFFDISPDGKTLVASRGDLQSDAIVVSGFQ